MYLCFVLKNPPSLPAVVCGACVMGGISMEEHRVPSAEQTAVAYSGAALAVTNFTLHPASPGMMRLSFLESAPDGSNPQFRCAVLLDSEGMRNLAELLLRLAPPQVGASG